MVKKKSWFNTLNRKGEGNGFLEGLRSKVHAATAAAEAAVTTALVDAEIVQFTSTPQYNHQRVNELEVFSVIRVQDEAPQCNYQCMREILNLLPPEFSLPLGVYLVSLKKPPNIKEKSLDIYSFQRLASDLINLLLEFQNVEATYCVLQHDDHWMCTKCHFKQILCLA
ncbi:hypothetical protein CMV_022359 [Castanea mollissima]|uniref:Uncharacterized protein n=1 Tax=Castanea mollissima TaxID=60419 RepID=A0A8J4VEE7_9ROSI|nr:hypothetical protein CMV_022359 [Castanea mollissima]